MNESRANEAKSKCRTQPELRDRNHEFREFHEINNQKLAAVAAAGGREAGAEVTVISLRDFALPIFDGDLEAASGMPEAAKRLKAIFREHKGLIIASPEYNSSISAALKNATDWVSRGESGAEPSSHRSRH